MKAKKKLKIFALIVLGVALFCAGFAVHAMHEMFDAFSKPQVQSDSSIRGAIENRVGSLPALATNLYYATMYFVEADTFIAFEIEKSDCDKWLNDTFGIKEGIPEQLKPLPKRIAERGPGSWEPRYKDPNWNLPAGAQVIVYDDNKWTIVYFQDGGRLFMCLWGR